MNEKMERTDKILRNIATKNDISMIMKRLEEIVKLFNKTNQKIVILNHSMQRLSIRVEVLEANI